jgi:exodeoxyribonuclease-3
VGWVRLYSWNINGMRASLKKGLPEWLAATGAEVLCVQETKCDPATLPTDGLRPAGYHGHWAVAERKGYSGVATFCREPAESWRIGLGIERFDGEGRVVMTRVGDLELYNIYFPNGGRGPERVAYKLAFYEVFLDLVDARLAAGQAVIWCGDVNTAHRPIDLARPKANEKISGFLPEERAWLDRVVERGWVDTFRHFHPDVAGAYTWWDQRFGSRARDVGWRIDYFFVPQLLIPRLRGAGIDKHVLGSDHCPVWIEIEA